MLTYEEALDYVYSFVDYGAVRIDKYSPETFNLARMVGFLEALGNPHRRYPVLHVAGTKGKGSVAAMCASALRAGGYRTGFYTSPHLLTFAERVQVDGQYIPREAVARLVERMRALVPQHPGITTFELTTALGFLYFAEQNVDAAVVEVGLGGRLDATNVVVPRVSVITALSYDHTYLLGDTLAEIAAEKGGIIKPGVPLVTAPQPAEALAVLERLAAERGAPHHHVGRHWLYRPVAHSLDSQVFEVWSAEEQRQLNALAAEGHAVRWQPTRLEIPLLGRHQVDNAATAYAALHALRQQGLPLAHDAIAAGLRGVHWPGRFEIVARAPFVVLDGAHNADSAEKLANALDDYFPGRRVVLVFGASSDKDVSGMLDHLLRPGSGVAHVVVTQAVHPRAQEPDTLAALVRQAGSRQGRLLAPTDPRLAPAAGPANGPVVTEAPSVAQAMASALELAKPDDVIAVTGSLFIVAEARAAVLERT